jgi:hypothetical protein
LSFVLNQKAHDFAGGVGVDFGELLHHLDQADDVAFCHAIASVFVRRLIRRRPPIENPRKRTEYLMFRHPRTPF